MQTLAVKQTSVNSYDCTKTAYEMRLAQKDELFEFEHFIELFFFRLKTLFSKYREKGSPIRTRNFRLLIEI